MLAGNVSPVRAEVNHGQGFSEIVFRRTDRWKGAIRLLFLVPAWLFGGLFAFVLLSVGNDNGLMLTAWLVLWGLGGLVLFGVIVWSSFAVESLIVRSDELTLLRRLLVLSRPTVLPAAELRDIGWLADNLRRSVRVNGRRIPQTALNIETESGSFTCAAGISETEAQSTIAAVQQRLRIGGRRA